MKIYISMPNNHDSKFKRDKAIDVLKYHYCNEDVDFYYLEGEDLQTSVPILEKAIKYMEEADKIVLMDAWCNLETGRASIESEIAHSIYKNKVIELYTLENWTKEYRNRHMVVREEREEDSKKVKKIFISQPLSGIPEEESTKQRLKAEGVLRKYYESKGEEVEFLHHTEELAPDDIKNKRIWYLGRSISILADADAIAFLPGWKKAPGCCIESEVASRYNIEVIPQWVLESMFVDEKYAAAFTVGELMNELKKYPADRPVCFNATIESKIDAYPLQFIVNQCNLMIPDKYLEENL